MTYESYPVHMIGTLLTFLRYPSCYWQWDLAWYVFGWELQFFFTDEPSDGITAGGRLNLLGFCIFESCVGIFWPSIMKMRSQYIPEESRSTIMNFFRIPLNIFVCVVLYNVSVTFHLLPFQALHALLMNRHLEMSSCDSFSSFWEITVWLIWIVLECYLLIWWILFYRWAHSPSQLCLECAQSFWQWHLSCSDGSCWCPTGIKTVSCLSCVLSLWIFWGFQLILFFRSHHHLRGRFLSVTSTDSVI